MKCPLWLINKETGNIIQPQIFSWCIAGMFSLAREFGKISKTQTNFY